MYLSQAFWRQVSYVCMHVCIQREVYVYVVCMCMYVCVYLEPLWAHHVFLNIPDTPLNPSHHFSLLSLQRDSLISLTPVVAGMLSAAVLATGAGAGTHQTLALNLLSPLVWVLRETLGGREAWAYLSRARRQAGLISDWSL